MARIGEWSLPSSPMKEDTYSLFYLKSGPFATLLRGEPMDEKKLLAESFPDLSPVAVKRFGALYLDHMKPGRCCVDTWQQHDFTLQCYLFSDLPFSASITSVAVFSVITRKTALGNLATRYNRDPLPAAWMPLY